MKTFFPDALGLKGSNVTHEQPRQLASYIALGAPATRRPASSDQPFLRPEVGFTPRWYRDALGINFGERWHCDPSYRRDTIVWMAREIRKRFGERGRIGVLQDPDQPRDLITGTFGALLLPGIYGVPIVYNADDWPWCQPGQLLDDKAADNLEPPNLDDNPFWNEFMGQLDWIQRECGRIEGFMNWQGVLNTSYRLRGEALFVDMISHPHRVKRIFESVTTTMVEAARRLYERQKNTGVEYTHYTISNCLVNLLSARQYEEFQLPYDRRIAESFSTIGIHNCAWNADPYVPHYATLPNVAYIDMGLDSNLVAAKRAFPAARRAIMYTPMEVKAKTAKQLSGDFERIAQEYGPCDLVLADIESGTPDERIIEMLDLCEELSERYTSLSSASG